MDGLHATLAAIRTETKSEKDHLTVFREFLAQLDELQRHVPVKPARRVTRASRHRFVVSPHQSWAAPSSRAYTAAATSTGSSDSKAGCRRGGRGSSPAFPR